MQNLRILALAFTLIWGCVQPTFAQVPPISESQARNELNKLGLSEEDFNAKLLEKGIDIEKIDLNNPQELLRLQKAIEEIEAEQNLKENQPTDFPTPGTEIVTPPPTIEDAASNVERQASTSITELPEVIDEENEIGEVLVNGLAPVAEVTAPPTTIYGQHIFREKNISVFLDGNTAYADNSYILGPGDKIGVSLWGVSELDVVLEVNKEGFIKPQGMARINLKGITLEKAKELLRRRFSNYYTFGKDQFEVLVAYPRPITVHIVGEVINSGSYTMPAVNTAFNALAAAGGPSDIGSVRNIKIIRSGGAPRSMDIYEYLLDPSINKDYYLQDNDIIHVAVADRLVSLQGAVRRPFKYELKKNEQLKDLVKYAGNFNPNAYQSNLKVKRFENDKEKIIDVNYRTLLNSSQDFVLNSGDNISVGVIPKPYQNFVEISGAVDLPGKYELEGGMKINDLIKKGVLAEFAKTDQAYLIRTNKDGTLSYSRVNLENANDNMSLQPKDRLIVFSKEKYLDKYDISIDGAVRFPSKYEFDPSEKLTVEDLIILGGGLRKDATDFAYIYRTKPDNTKAKEYIRFDIKNAIENPDSPDNIVLQPNDQIQVFSKLTYIDEFSINVTGEVRNPGQYQYHESLTLKDVLLLSGGLKIMASSNRVDIFRTIINKNESTKTVVATIEVDENFEITSGNNFTLEPFDQIVVRSVPEFELQRFVQIEGEVKYPGGYAILEDNEKLLSLIKRAGDLTGEAFPEGATLYREDGGTGYIVLRLDETLKNPKDRHNFILKEGDIISIPKRKDLVTISGAIRAAEVLPSEVVGAGKINVAYHPGKRAKWYVDEYAAGIGKDGRSKLITVEYANGEIKRTKNYLLFKVHPKVKEGSIVRVGVKPPKPPRQQGERGTKKIDWGDVLADSVAQATAILSLILLVERVN